SFHAALKLPSKFDWTRNIQPTWGPLIRIILAFDGTIGEPGRDKVAEFQTFKLGSRDAHNCVLDLSPLPSPSTAKWKLNEFGFPWLNTRREYEEQHLASRCHIFREKLALHKPNLVIFYGLKQKSWWEKIAQSQFLPSQDVEGLSLVHTDTILFAMIPH